MGWHCLILFAEIPYPFYMIQVSLGPVQKPSSCRNLRGLGESRSVLWFDGCPWPRVQSTLSHMASPTQNLTESGMTSDEMISLGTMQ